MVSLSPYSLYIKLAAGVVLASGLLGAGWHFGALGPETKLAQLQAKQAQDEAKQSGNIATAVLAERAAAEAERAKDHKTEQSHANDLSDIDHTTSRTDPVFVRVRSRPVCVGSVPGTEGQANSVGTNTAEGGGQQDDRGSDIRPAIEALKKRLERIMADYRQLDAEWSTK